MVQNNEGHFRPYVDSTYDIGETNTRVRNVYADTYYGDGTNLTGIDTDLVNDTTPQLGGDLDTNSHNINLDDDHAVNFGDDTDLVIKHTGSNANITNATGDLVIRTLGTNADDIFIDSKDDINIRVHDTDDAIKCIGDGAVELYHNNVKRLETHTEGITSYGHSLFITGDEGESAQLLLYADDGDDNADRWKILASAGGPFYLQNYTSGSWESNIIAYGNGQVELYHDNSKKFETISGGTSITGSLGINTTSPAVLIDARTTSGGSIQVQNTSSNIGVLGINVGSAENFIYSKGDGATAKRDLTFMLGTSKAARFDTNLHFRPESDSTHDLGLTGTRWRNVYADTLYGGKARITDDGSDSPLLSVRADDSNPWGLVVGNDSADSDGNSGLRVYQNDNRDVYIQSYAGSGSGSTFNNTYIQHCANSAYNPITFTSGQQVEIRMNGDVVPRITTDASSATYASIKVSGSNGSNTAYGGVSINNTINLLGHLSDGIFGIYDQHTGKWVFWYDDGDGTYIYHDNKWAIRTLSVGAGINSNGNATELKVYSNNGAIRGSLYGDNSNNFGLLDNGGNWHIKFDSGRDAHFYGHASPSSDNTYDLGSSSKRWRNVYTTDLHLSNEGSSNDVDSTWGDWTIQEGESDLFLKNNRSGKKYKFNLTEVS